MHKYLRLKLLLLVSVLFIGVVYLGCGSGENKNASSSGNTGSGNNGTQTSNDTINPGYLMINFSQESAQASPFLSMSSNPATLSNPSNVRIIIRNFITMQTVDDLGDPVTETITSYSKILDISTSASTSIPVAPGNGYKVELISFKAFSDHNTMYKYGVINGVNIVSGTTTSVSVTLAPIDVNLQVLPNSIPSGSIANVIAATGYPLRTDKQYVRYQNTAISNVFSTTTGTTSFSFTAPSLLQSDPPQTLYFQGLFLLDPHLLNAGESTTLFRYYEPNPSELLDSQLTGTVLPPGSVGITITL